jgi:hypothetical protein
LPACIFVIPDYNFLYTKKFSFHTSIAIVLDSYETFVNANSFFATPRNSIISILDWVVQTAIKTLLTLTITNTNNWISRRCKEWICVYECLIRIQNDCYWSISSSKVGAFELGNFVCSVRTWRKSRWSCYLSEEITAWPGPNSFLATPRNSIISILDWVVQTAIKTLLTLTITNCTWNVYEIILRLRFNLHLRFNWHLVLIEACATQSRWSSENNVCFYVLY